MTETLIKGFTTITLIYNITVKIHKVPDMKFTMEEIIPLYHQFHEIDDPLQPVVNIYSRQKTADFWRAVDPNLQAALFNEDLQYYYRLYR